jgi:dihydrodipicolinate synthase/N-acetylneuraminate lyase
MLGDEKETEITSGVVALTGILPALPTAFNTDGSVDFNGTREVVRYVLRAGVHGLWAFGSSAEFTCLAEEERRQILEVIIGEAASRVPVVVGIDDRDLRKVARYAETAALTGATACFVIAPSYYTLTEDETLRYFEYVAERCPLPLVIYDNPSVTKKKIDPRAWMKVANCKKFVALKDSSGDFVRFLSLLAAARSKTSWSVLQGDERLVGVSLLIKAHGAVAALANVFPRLFLEIYNAAMEQKLERVGALQEEILATAKLFEVLGKDTDGSFFASLKAGLEVLGLCKRWVAVPFCPVADKDLPKIEKFLDSHSRWIRE